MLIYHIYFAKVGTQILFLLPQIANPQTLGLIPHSEIRKFLRYASTYANCKSENCLVPVHKSQIRKFARKKAVFLIQIIFFFTFVVIF
jgi:hypothetical protein